MSSYYELQRAIGRIRLIDTGGTNTSAHAPWEPYCDSPVPIVRKERGGHNMITGKPLPGLELTMKGPCRKCEKCLLFRRLKWKERAIDEVRRAPRTWAGNLTFTDRMIALAIAEMKRRGSATFEPILYGEVAKYLKRLRKAGARFRYLMIYERGEETGRSHYHFLFHEIHGQPEVPKRLIERKWAPHVHVRLIDQNPESVDRAVNYVTAYTTKDFECRPRPSQRYGKQLVG